VKKTSKNMCNLCPRLLDGYIPRAESLVQHLASRPVTSRFSIRAVVARKRQTCEQLWVLVIALQDGGNPVPASSCGSLWETLEMATSIKSHQADEVAQQAICQPYALRQHGASIRNGPVVWTATPRGNGQWSLQAACSWFHSILAEDRCSASEQAFVAGGCVGDVVRQHVFQAFARVYA
jgi:hypothetical protein